MRHWMPKLEEDTSRIGSVPARSSTSSPSLIRSLDRPTPSSSTGWGYLKNRGYMLKWNCSLTSLLVWEHLSLWPTLNLIRLMSYGLLKKGFTELVEETCWYMQCIALSLLKKILMERLHLIKVKRFKLSKFFIFVQTHQAKSKKFY